MRTYLLDRIGRGDIAAFEIFYDRHCRVAYGLAFHILGETEAACAFLLLRVNRFASVVAIGAATRWVVHRHG